MAVTIQNTNIGEYTNIALNNIFTEYPNSLNEIKECLDNNKYGIDFTVLNLNTSIIEESQVKRHCSTKYRAESRKFFNFLKNVKGAFLSCQANKEISNSEYHFNIKESSKVSDDIDVYQILMEHEIDTNIPEMAKRAYIDLISYEVSRQIGGLLIENNRAFLRIEKLLEEDGELRIPNCDIDPRLRLNIQACIGDRGFYVHPETSIMVVPPVCNSATTNAKLLSFIIILSKLNNNVRTLEYAKKALKNIKLDNDINVPAKSKEKIKAFYKKAFQVAYLNDITNDGTMLEKLIKTISKTHNTSDIIRLIEGATTGNKKLTLSSKINLRLDSINIDENNIDILTHKNIDERKFLLTGNGAKTTVLECTSNITKIQKNNEISFIYDISGISISYKKLNKPHLVLRKEKTESDVLFNLIIVSLYATIIKNKDHKGPVYFKNECNDERIHKWCHALNTIFHEHKNSIPIIKNILTDAGEMVSAAGYSNRCYYIINSRNKNSSYEINFYEAHNSVRKIRLKDEKNDCLWVVPFEKHNLFYDLNWEADTLFYSPFNKNENNRRIHILRNFSNTGGKNKIVEINHWGNTYKIILMPMDGYIIDKSIYDRDERLLTSLINIKTPEIVNTDIRTYVSIVPFIKSVMDGASKEWMQKGG